MAWGYTNILELKPIRLVDGLNVRDEGRKRGSQGPII